MKTTLEKNSRTAFKPVVLALALIASSAFCAGEGLFGEKNPLGGVEIHCANCETISPFGEIRVLEETGSEYNPQLGELTPFELAPGRYQTLSASKIFSANNDGVNDDPAIVAKIKTIMPRGVMRGYQATNPKYQEWLELAKNAARKYYLRAYDENGRLVGEALPETDSFSCSLNDDGATQTCWLPFTLLRLQSNERFYEVELKQVYAGKNYVYAPKLTIFVTQTNCDACGSAAPGIRQCTAAKCANYNNENAGIRGGLRGEYSGCVYSTAGYQSGSPCLPATYAQSDAPAIKRMNAEASALDRRTQDETERYDRAKAMLQREVTLLNEYIQTKERRWSGQEYSLAAIVIKAVREKRKLEFNEKQLQTQVNGVNVMLNWMENGMLPADVAANWNAEAITRLRKQQRSELEQQLIQNGRIQTNTVNIGGRDVVIYVPSYSELPRDFFAPQYAFAASDQVNRINAGKYDASTTRPDTNTPAGSTLEQFDDQTREILTSISETLANPVVRMLLEKEKQRKFTEVDEAKMLINYANEAEKQYDYVLALHYYSLIKAQYGLESAKEKMAAMYYAVAPPQYVGSWWWNCLSPMTDYRFLPLVLLQFIPGGQFAGIAINTYFIVAGTDGLIKSIREIRRDGRWQQMTDVERNEFGLQTTCQGAMIVVGAIGLAREGFKLMQKEGVIGAAKTGAGTAAEAEAAASRGSRRTVTTNADAPAFLGPELKGKTAATASGNRQTFEVIGRRQSTAAKTSIMRVRPREGPGLIRAIGQAVENLRRALTDFDSEATYRSLSPELRLQFDDFITTLERSWRESGIAPDPTKIPVTVAKIRKTILYQHSLTDGTIGTTHGVEHVVTNFRIQKLLAEARNGGSLASREIAVNAIKQSLHDLGYTHPEILESFKASKAHGAASTVLIDEVFRPDFEATMDVKTYAKLLKGTTSHQKSVLFLDQPDYAWVADEAPVQRATTLTRSRNAMEFLRDIRDGVIELRRTGDQTVVIDKQTGLPIEGKFEVIKSRIRGDLKAKRYGEAAIERSLQGLSQANKPTFDLHYSTFLSEDVIPGFDPVTQSIVFDVKVTRQGIEALHKAGLLDTYLRKTWEGFSERGGDVYVEGLDVLTGFEAPSGVTARGEIVSAAELFTGKPPKTRVAPGAVKKVVIKYSLVDGPSKFADVHSYLYPGIN